jgi:hypothetical protein
MAHIIRLQGPWDRERIEPAPGHNGLRLTRRFGCSAGLKSAERVWLALEDVGGRAAIALNGTSLGTVNNNKVDENSIGQPCPAKFVITHLLQPRNVLVIEVSADNQSTNANAADDLGAEFFGAEFLGSVQLEIE